MSHVRAGGGWHAIQYTLRKAREAGTVPLIKAMTSRNSCKTCALGMGGQKGGMRNEHGHFPEFCKKSIQAMVADMQPGIPDELFQQHSIDELQKLNPHQLESLGRISTPLYKGPGATHLQTISWEQAESKIVSALQQTDPQRSFFYFSGRSSNEAGFLLQLFCRIFGTNHVNNCSFYCHQASGVGLKDSVGTGTATITLSDLQQCDLLFIIGANPASNHPRLMTMCRDIRKKGGKIVVVNPLNEVGLVRFSIPSDPRSLWRPSAIGSHFLQVKPGGDFALMLALAKQLLLTYPQAIDQGFVDQHTVGFDQLKERLEQLSMATLEKLCGIDTNQIQEVAALIAKSKNTVYSWAMGVTHQLQGADTVQSIVNLALLRGMVGREGAGLLPLRGHSNVQGMGSMGVKPIIGPEQQQALSDLGVEVPDHQGFDTLSCVESAFAGNMDFAMFLGGNLFGASPDANYTATALSRLSFSVQLNTTLNTGHVHGLGREAIILPVAARDEEEQATTQESMFNYVRISEGGPQRISQARPETKIIASIAKQYLKKVGKELAKIDFNQLHQHDEIRKLIAMVFNPFSEIYEKVKTGQEFYIPGRILHQQKFPTPNGKSKFFVPDSLFQEGEETDKQDQALTLVTIRSEGQFNTVVYEEEDRYRNQKHRDIVLMNPADIDRLKLSEYQSVLVQSAVGKMGPVSVASFDIKVGCVAMYFPEANVLVNRDRDVRTKTPAFKYQRVKVTPFI